LNQESHRKLISGECGCQCPCVGLDLSFAALGYALVIRLRNFLYDKGGLKAHKVNAKVISIGNITVGGTGKTPLVVWLCNTISQKSKVKSQKCGCAILTRGYKTHTQTRGTRDEGRGTRDSSFAAAPDKSGLLRRMDEGRETKIDELAILAECCPQAKVIVNPDRVAGAVEAITKFGAKVLIMDDGFQHRRLHRNLDIVTIDATCPFGYGRMLPAGLLREPITSLKRADAIVITRCEQVHETEISMLEEKLREVNQDIIIARSIHRPICAKFADGKEIGIEQLKEKKTFAFCGIGNPQAFLGTIKSTGAELVGSKIYDDHHHYSPEDLTCIYEQARAIKADLILTTQKDWSKIIGDFRFSIPPDGPATQMAGKRQTSSDFQPPIPLAYLAIELKFISGEDKIRNLIEKALAGKISKK
jgi:tetraacyldisaccharide 4'-kinase